MFFIRSNFGLILGLDVVVMGAVVVLILVGEDGSEVDVDDIGEDADEDESNLILSSLDDEEEDIPLYPIPATIQAPSDNFQAAKYF